MNITNVETKENSTVELTIHVDGVAFEAAVQKAYLTNRGQINVAGFRKGKAPRKIIESMYGVEVFYQDAVEAVYPAAYDAAVAEQGLDDVGYPQLEMVDTGKDGLTFKALVTVRPVATMGQYKDLTAPQDVAEVTADDIEKELAPLVQRATRLVSVEREVAMGDTAIIDFEGFDAGVAFEGGQGENYSLEIGSGSFIPGFEEQVVGMKIGEEKDLDITFPTDYVPDLAGKAVVFKVKVNEVKTSDSPAIDDEFAKDVSEFETLEDLKKDLGEKLAERRANDAKQAFEESIMEQLVDNMECEVPNVMVDVQLDKLMDDYAMRMQNQGMKLDDYLSMTGMTMDTMRASARPTALRQVQMELAMTAIATAEDIVITDEAVDAEMQKLADQYKLELAQVKAAIAPEMLKRDLKLQMAADVVLETAKVGPAPEKKEVVEEKPKRATRKKKTDEETVEGEEKPKRATRKKKTDETVAE